MFLRFLLQKLSYVYVFIHERAPSMLHRISESYWGMLFILGSSLMICTFSVWIADPDIFWHLKVGEWIVTYGSVPRYDVYSWSVYGEPWTAHQWAWYAIMYFLHDQLGILGLWLLALAAALLSGFLVRAGLLAAGISSRIALAVGGIVPLLLIGWLRPWPQAGVYVMFSAYLYFSLKKTWAWKDIALISILGLVWSNIHSTAVMLPLLLLAEIFWYRVFRKVPFTSLKLQVTAVLTSGLMTLVNPHGIGLWQYAVGQGLLTGAYREHISLWAPYVFSYDNLSIYIFFVSVAILFFAVKQDRNKSLEFVRALLFWVLALLSNLYTPYALLSTAVLLGTFKFQLGAKSLMRIGLVSLAIGISISFYLGMPDDLEEIADKWDYPVAAVQVIKEDNLERVYNRFGWGGYLLWEDIPVYIDGRNDVYGSLFLDFVNISNNEQPLGDVIAETGAETVLFPVNSTVDHALKEASLWDEYYRDEVAVIYIRINEGEWM